MPCARGTCENALKAVKNDLHSDRTSATTFLANAMRLLLDKGADVNARNAAGATALMWAATDLAKVRVLVDRGAEVARGGIDEMELQF